MVSTYFAEFSCTVSLKVKLSQMVSLVYKMLALDLLLVVYMYISLAQLCECFIEFSSNDFLKHPLGIIFKRSSLTY